MYKSMNVRQGLAALLAVSLATSCTSIRYEPVTQHLHSLPASAFYFEGNVTEHIGEVIQREYIHFYTQGKTNILQVINGDGTSVEYRVFNNRLKVDVRTLTENGTITINTKDRTNQEKVQQWQDEFDHYLKLIEQQRKGTLM